LICPLAGFLSQVSMLFAPPSKLLSCLTIACQQAHIFSNLT